MTTSKVTQIMSMLSSPELKGMSKQSQEPGLAFGAFLNQAPGNGNQDLFSTEGPGKATTNDTVNHTAYQKESAKSGYRENTVVQSNQADAPKKLPQNAAEKIQAFTKQVKEVIAEELGISEEELTQQMEAMGLTVMDLMNPSKLAGLVMELMGSEDIGGLLLSEDFQQILSQVSDLSQQLAAQLNLTPEEMNQLLEQMKLMELQGSQQEDILNAGELSEDAEVLSQNTEDVKAGQAEYGAALQTDASEQKNSQELTDGVKAQGEAESQEQGKSQSVSSTAQGQEDAGQQANDKSNGAETELDLAKETKAEDKGESRQTHVTYQTTTQNIGQGQVMEVTQTVVQARVDMEDILRQVSQMTRVFVNQAESSIEMQLNPANLGKIYLQVLSREGVITAQIAAQNEVVKEALENQVAMLKENMNQQGLKVEAIEVTIASHEFERNLEENQQNTAKEQQEQEAAKDGRRNLNLNSLDELEGVMSEEESLAAKMMAEQGNSMDITA